MREKKKINGRREKNEGLLYYKLALIRLDEGNLSEALAALEAAAKRGADLKVLLKGYKGELPEKIAEMYTSEGTQEED